MAEKRAAGDDAEGEGTRTRQRMDNGVWIHDELRLPLHAHLQPVMGWRRYGDSIPMDDSTTKTMLVILRMMRSGAPVHMMMNTIVDMLVLTHARRILNHRTSLETHIAMLHANPKLVQYMRTGEGGAVALIPAKWSNSIDIRAHIREILKTDPYAAAQMLRYWLHTYPKNRAMGIHDLFMNVCDEHATNAGHMLSLLPNVLRTGSAHANHRAQCALLFNEGIFDVSPPLPVEILDATLANDLVGDPDPITIIPELAPWWLTTWHNEWACSAINVPRLLMERLDADIVAEQIRLTWKCPPKFYKYVMRDDIAIPMLTASDTVDKFYRCGHGMWKWLCSNAMEQTYNVIVGMHQHNAGFVHALDFGAGRVGESIATLVHDARVCNAYDLKNMVATDEYTLLEHVGLLLDTVGGRALFKVLPWIYQLDLMLHATPKMLDNLRGDAKTHFLSKGKSLVPTLKGMCSRFLKGSQFSKCADHAQGIGPWPPFSKVNIPPPTDMYPDPMAFAEMMRQDDYST